MPFTYLPKVILHGPIESAGKPLYECELKVDYPGNPELVEAPASVRVLSLNRTAPSGRGGRALERPLLLRLSGRVRKLVFSGASEGLKGDSAFDVITASEAPDDSPWQGIDEAQISHLRLTEGRIESFITPNSALGKLLQLTKDQVSGGGSVLGSLPCVLDPGKKALAVTITPAGIEFRATVPIPAPGNRTVEGATLRLSWEPHPDQQHPESVYQLELVDGGSVITAALAKTFGAPRDAGAPLEFDFNSTVAVPPVSWPLALKQGKLSLDGAQSVNRPVSWTAWKARLDGSAVRSRMHTNVPRRRVQETRLAEVQAAVVLLELSGGVFTASAMSDYAATPAADVCTWTPDPKEVWTPAVSFQGGDVFIDTEPVQSRLLPVYRKNRVWEEESLNPTPSDPTPHAFFPVNRGWLQYKLPDKDLDPKTPSKDTLAGEVNVAIDSCRSLRIEGAARATMGATWDARSGEVKSVFLQADFPQGSCSGFLYFAEASPDAFDALPNLQAGPIATHDLPVSFGTSLEKRRWIGHLENRGNGMYKLTLNQPALSNPEASYLWRRAARLPLIPNMPHTNGPAASGRASTTRGLFPGELRADIILTFAKDVPLPDVMSEAVWPAGILDSNRPESFPLSLPTLPGAEFYGKTGPDDVTAALRFDLPILDELFATTPLPTAKPANGATAGVIPSALTLRDLAAQVWEPNRRKLTLAKTDKALATGAVVPGSAPINATVDSLVEPYRWTAPFTVFGPDHPPVGSYTLDGASFWAEEASQGMPDRRFRINGGNLAVDPQGKIKAKNFAVDLIDNTDMVQDSRGFQIARSAKPGPAGTAIRDVVDINNKNWRWATAPQPYPVAKARNFWFRDLAFASDQWIFDGDNNPIEKREAGQDGQAFRPEFIAQALHEWRLYTPDSNRYDLDFGDTLRIWPLRLLHVEMDNSGPSKLQILVRVDLRSQSPLTTAPFSVDQAYGQGNQATLDAIAGTLSAATLSFRDTFNWNGRAVAATLTYKMPEGEDGSLKGSWGISFEFAGEQVELSGGTRNGTTIQFAAFGPAELKIAVSADLVARTLTLSPALTIRTSGGGQAIGWTGADVSWFGMNVQQTTPSGAAKDPWISLDTGALRLQFKSDNVKGDLEIVPGVRLGDSKVQGVLQLLTGATAVRTLYAEIWAQDSSLKIVHRMVVKDPTQPLVLDQMLITGKIQRQSRIEWPDVGPPTTGTLSVVVKVPKADTTWLHSFTIFLNRHEYPLGRIGGFGAGWDFDATVRHTLTRGQETFSWDSLDRIGILSADEFRTRVAQRRDDLSGYLPVRRNSINPHYTYRGVDIYARIFFGGIAAGDLASSGLWDQDLAAAFQNLKGSLILGGGLTLFSDGVPLVWHYVAPTDPSNTSFPLLQQRDPRQDTFWRLSAPDVPPRISVEERDASTIHMSTPTERQLRSAVESQPPVFSKFERWLDPDHTVGGGAVILQPEWVEQILFEWTAAAEDVRQQQRTQRGIALSPQIMPFFLGSLLAIQRIHADQATARWSLRVCEMDIGKCTRIFVNTQSAPSPAPVAPHPQIVALSRTEGVAIGDVTPADVVNPAKARLTSIARNLLSQPIAAVLRDEAGPILNVQDLLPPVLDLHAPPGPNPAEALPVTAPSAALGWPALVSADDAVKINPTIGAEAVTVDRSAGLAGRTAATAWPAYGPDASHSPWAIYLNSHAPVVFERPAEAVEFQGPAARHLSPAPSRVRAPLFSDVRTALLKLAPDPTMLQPISTPGLERGVVGLRPGAFHVITNSATVTGGPQDNTDAFDSDYPRFGRPASRGSVIAHQLRAPRGTPLPRDNDFALRRRTFLSEVEPDKLFGKFEGPATVWRDDLPNGIGKWRFALQPERDQRPLSADWAGSFKLFLDAVSPGNMSNLRTALDLTGLTSARCMLWIGESSFVFDRLDATQLPKIVLKLDRFAEAADALGKASPDTSISLRIDLHPPGLPVVPLKIPLQLQPPDRAVLEVSTTTIAFGDPSYDRQLGSPAQMDIRLQGSTYAISADRRQYERTGAMYFAFGQIDSDGLFAKGTKASVTISRFPATGEPPEEVDTRDRDSGIAHLVSIPDLRPKSGQSWASGDQLRVAVSIDGVVPKLQLQIFVSIVDEPQIAPPPSVYSLVRIGEHNAFADVPLHASGPMPQRIEFPSLLEDLAKGHVRRRALFLWQWSEVRQGGVCTLVKIDRSGGCQIVVPITLSIQNGKLLATVVGTGSLGVENGLMLLSQQFDVAGSTDVDLGPANQGVYGFKFVLNGDSSSLLAILDAAGGLTVLGDAVLGSGGPLPTAGVLAKFWSNLTPDLLQSALTGALGDWIKSNVVGAPLLVVLGFVSGGTAFAVMALSKGADLAAAFIIQVADAELAAGSLTQSEADSIKRWATVTDGVLQIPSIVTAEATLEKAAGALAAVTNVVAENADVKLSATYSSDLVAKYALALKAIKK
jgi:hypothetical protein